MGCGGSTQNEAKEEEPKSRSAPPEEEKQEEEEGYVLLPEEIEPNNHEYPDEVLNTTLHHLAIPTSHNSYLWGSQNVSPADVRAVRNCLRRGARSIELDIWSGDNDEPIVAHGTAIGKLDLFTTSSIKLEACFAEIAGFETNDPIFLTFELNDHKNIAVQNNIAKLLKQYFGERLHQGSIEWLPLRAMMGKVMVLVGVNSCKESDLWASINFWFYSWGFNIEHPDKESLPEERRSKIGRVYPAGDMSGHFSDNFNARPFLKYGVTFVALNYQTIEDYDTIVRRITLLSEFDEISEEEMPEEEKEKLRDEKKKKKQQEKKREKEEEEKAKQQEEEKKEEEGEKKEEKEEKKEEEKEEKKEEKEEEKEEKEEEKEEKKEEKEEEKEEKKEEKEEEKEEKKEDKEEEKEEKKEEKEEEKEEKKEEKEEEKEEKKEEKEEKKEE